MVMAPTDREFGEFLGNVKSIQKDVSRIETGYKELDKKVDMLIRRFDRMDGALKLSMWLAGFFGAIGMFVLTKVVPLLIPGIPRL